MLHNAVRGISDLITVHGLINLDFADVRTIMNEMGVALMGTGVARGEERAEEAARMAISSPLLEDLSIDGAHGVLINITGGPDLTLYEVNEASTLIQEAAHEDANIIFGAVIDESIPEGEIRVTVIATGLEGDRMRRGRDRDVPIEDGGKVTPLRREPVPVERAPLSAERADYARAEQTSMLPPARSPHAASRAAAGARRPRGARAAAATTGSRRSRTSSTCPTFLRRRGARKRTRTSARARRSCAARRTERQRLSGREAKGGRASARPFRFLARRAVANSTNAPACRVLAAPGPLRLAARHATC